MGINTVAVLYNDFTHEYEKDGPLGARIASAMRNCGYGRDEFGTWFGAGKVISQAHADYLQIVVVGRNWGWPLEQCDNLDWMALETLSKCLIRHGYTVRPPKRQKHSA